MLYLRALVLYSCHLLQALMHREVILCKKTVGHRRTLYVYMLGSAVKTSHTLVAIVA